MTIAHDLPRPLLSTYDWQTSGSCRRADPELFFLESVRGHAKARQVAAAKAVCAACPVQQNCLEHGLTVHEPYGIWGGLTVEERQERWRQQRRARAASRSKTPVARRDPEDAASAW